MVILAALIVFVFLVLRYLPPVPIVSECPPPTAIVILIPLNVINWSIDIKIVPNLWYNKITTSAIKRFTGPEGISAFVSDDSVGT